jgi:hypothetical protein
LIVNLTVLFAAPTAAPIQVEISTATPIQVEIETTTPTAKLTAEVVPSSEIPTYSPTSFYTYYPTSHTYAPTLSTYYPTTKTYSPTDQLLATDIPTSLILESVSDTPTYLATANGITRSNPCPDVLDKKTTLQDGLGLSYEIIVDNDRQLLCSELEYEGEGWLGLGVSERGDMSGSTAVIGLPGTTDDTTKPGTTDDTTNPNPGLYSLDGKENSSVQLLSDDLQTILLGASIIQENGLTVLRFATYVNDSNEDFAIKVPGVTTFIYAAADSNEFGYHGMKRGSLSLVLSNAKSWKKANKQNEEQQNSSESDQKKKKKQNKVS